MPAEEKRPRFGLRMLAEVTQITRATNIEFNNSTQQWEVKNRKGKVRFIAKSRAACLEWEQRHLQPETPTRLTKPTGPGDSAPCFDTPHNPACSWPETFPHPEASMRTPA
jgi:hypothetical protein